jgi:Mg/Co/Ni transporter MgtE
MSDEIKKRIDDALFEFYLNGEKGLIKDSFKDDVKDIDAYEKKKKRIAFLTMANAKKMHNEHLLELANKFHEAISSNIEKPIALLKQMLQGNASLSLYRNLDKLTKEDIVEIIKDKNLIQLLEQLDKNDEIH